MKLQASEKTRLFWEIIGFVCLIIGILAGLVLGYDLFDTKSTLLNIAGVIIAVGIITICVLMIPAYIKLIHKTITKL